MSQISYPITFCIEAQCYSMKNQRALIVLKNPDAQAAGIQCIHCGKQNRVISVPGDKARAFERAFKKQLPPDCRLKLTGRFRVDVAIYYPSDLQDLDEQLVFDLMQRYEVIENDRMIVKKWVEKFIDPARPRVEVSVIPVLWERSGLQGQMFGEAAPTIR